VRSRDQFFRIGALAVFESRLETVGRVAKNAGLGGNRSATILDAAVPHGPCLLDHITSIVETARRRCLRSAAYRNGTVAAVGQLPSAM
jgi:hypothetical protein